MMNQYEIDYKQGYDRANEEWIDEIEQAIEEIIELDGEYLTLYDGVNKLGNGFYIEMDEVIEILNRLIREVKE